MIVSRRQNVRGFLMAHVAFICAVPTSCGNRDMSRLVDFIFKDYDTSIWPRVNMSGPIELELGIGISAVVNLDTRVQTLNLCGFITALWTDDYLHWEPAEYGNITRVIVPQSRVWRPDLALIRSLDLNIYMGSEETKLIVYSDGRVSWQPNFNSKFTCNVDVAKFPLDENICQISVGSWMHNSLGIILSHATPHTLMEPGITNGEFDIAVEDPTLTLLYYDGLPHDIMNFRLKLSRKPAHMFISFLMPMFVIGLLCPVSFLIPPDNIEKLGISLNILLATTVCLGVVSGNLPDRSDNISSVAVYVVFLLVLSFLGVLGNTMVLLVHRREKLRRAAATAATAAASTATALSVNSKTFNGDDPKDKPNTSIPFPLNPHVPTGKRSSPRSKAENLNWLFFGLSNVGLIVSLLAVLVQIMTKG